MPMTASWYHCSVKVISRASGRSAVAAAAYRLGDKLHDERYDLTHDFTRKGGVLERFMFAPSDAPEWAYEPERLWNAAEARENRRNSYVAREVELALPAFLEPGERRKIVQQFLQELVDRYGVAVSAALHAPGAGDARNYHAHILFTTREMPPEGLGGKTRVLDDRKIGSQEIMHLRERAVEIINAALIEANSDIRVDHRSFKDRGISQEPTTHLGPSAAEMERRGETSDRGDINREAAQANKERREALDQIIADETQRESREPDHSEVPADARSDGRRRVRDDVQPFKDAIAARGTVADIQFHDGLAWWERSALRAVQLARNLGRELGERVADLWQDQTSGMKPESEISHRDRLRDTREHEPEKGWDR